MDLGLADARVLIQGGTSGVGREVARLMAAEGARVVVSGRSEQPELADELRSLGSPEACVVNADLASPVGVEEVRSVVEARWAHLNVVVNVAGPPVVRTPWQDIGDDRWLRSLEVGVLTAVRSTRASLSMLRTAPWGRVVNVSALSGSEPRALLADYGTAKSALNSASRAMSAELGSEGILVNVVSPGPVLGSRLAAALKDRGLDSWDTAAAMDVLRERHAVTNHLERVATPAEVALVVVFLASRANSHVTGANVPVDGGA